MNKARERDEKSKIKSQRSKLEPHPKSNYFATKSPNHWGVG